MIPNIIHFVFGMRSDFGNQPFSYVHYLAVMSAWKINKPEKIFFHYIYEPTGDWWQKAKQHLTLRKVNPLTEIFGNPLSHAAHRADVVRLDVLREFGGIYLDMDVICVNDFKPLLNYDCVMGIESRVGLCNAVILACKDSEFIDRWYDEYRNFNDQSWNYHSVILPYKMSKEFPDLIHIEGPNSFFYPHYRDPVHLLLWGKRIPRRTIYRILKANTKLLLDCMRGNLDVELNRPNFHIIFGQKWHYRQLKNAYCVHLWESLWWEKYLRDISPMSLKRNSGTFARLLRDGLQVL